MPPAPDGTKRTSEQQLSELVGIAAPLRQDWAKRGRLERRGRAGYKEADAVELAALKAMVDALGASDGPIAWAATRSTISAHADDPELVLVFDVQDKTAHAVSDMSLVRRAAPYGHRVLIVDLANPIQRVRAAFERVTAEL